MSSKVYVVQEDPRKNMLPALDFGSLEYLLDATDQVGFNARPWVKIIRRRLGHFTSDDFILAVGDPAAIGVACAYAAQKTGGRFKLLKWDRQEKRYYPVTIDMGGSW